MRPITHWLARLLPIIAMALCAVSPAQAVTIGVPENLPPWGLTSSLPVGQRGIYVDVADAVVSRSHQALEIKFVPYGRMLPLIKDGELDYAFGVVSPATSTAAPFLAVIGKAPMVAVARKGLSLKTLEDLRGFTEVGYLRGGSCGADVDGDAAIKRTGQDSYDSAIRKLASGRLDGWCSLKPGFVYALGQIKMEAEMGEQLDYGEYKIGMQVTAAKAESAEAHELAAIIDKLISDGTMGQIWIRYVGAPYTP
jgi:ABC-type amino acid transport substrate-binding protein